MVTAVARPGVASGRQVLGRVVRGTRTTPGRLVVAGVVLVVLALLSGVFAFLAVRERSQAAERVAERSEPLGARTQELYRALAEADAAAAAGLLSGGVEKDSLRDRYEQSLDDAQRLLTAASSAGATGRMAELITQLSVQIPLYREDVSRAKSASRQGFPLGASYLRAASRQMEQVILKDAADLHGLAAAKLRADHRQATAVPGTAVVAGLCALAALGVAQVLLARRTKRVFNPGLLLASAAVAASLVWVSTSLASARDDLDRSRDQGWQPVDSLSAARFSVLQARAAESQILVQHGSDGGQYEARLNAEFNELATADGAGGQLAAAAHDARNDPATQAQLAEARAAVGDWRIAHGTVMALYEQTDFKSAVAVVIDDKGSSQLAYNRAENALKLAIAKDQSDFDKAVREGRAAMDGLGIGVLVLAIVAAAGVVDGIRRRLGEYR
ncbi:hypothetical protein [Yinghuangia soli]|uniref:Secreted protein n=1 Tax=Yinghuangia soli TaxID=2908204 RepID=A0AA41U083_9ACTN|nr:hypothetical protein [Yinghuangia soli]MCF2526172.1 hypothetical protein [Yinghuangia soli]